MTDVKPYCHRFPMTIIQPAIWLYHRFPLSFWDAQDDRRGDAALWPADREAVRLRLPQGLRLTDSWARVGVPDASTV